jgi:hypothetical protein
VQRPAILIGDRDKVESPDWFASAARRDPATWESLMADLSAFSFLRPQTATAAHPSRPPLLIVTWSVSRLRTSRSGT